MYGPRGVRERARESGSGSESVREREREEGVRVSMDAVDNAHQKVTRGGRGNRDWKIGGTGRQPSSKTDRHRNLSIASVGLARESGGGGGGAGTERTAGACVHRPRGHHRREVGLALDVARSVDDVGQRDRQWRQG